MPGTTAGVYTGALTAGTEVSSTYEGRHLTVLEGEMLHPYIADGFVNKGDPVCLCDYTVPATYGFIVGVALQSATAQTDYIAIDTEGIFNLTVYADDDNGTRAIEIGDRLYIRTGAMPGNADADGTGDCEISKYSEQSHYTPFGYALGSLAAGGVGVIAVKVHAGNSSIISCHDLKALDPNERGSRQRATVALPAMDDGYGVWESQLDVSGLATGIIAERSDWINLGDDATVPAYLCVHTDGVYDGGATLTTAYIAWAKYSLMLSTNPAMSYLWELNFSGANSEVDCLFNVNDPALCLGYTAGAVSTVIGSIPLFYTAGGALRGWIAIYDAEFA